MPSNLLEYADRRASRSRCSRSQVVAAALAEVQVLEQTRLASEGYRFYAGEAREFAEISSRAAAEALSVGSDEGDADGRETW